MLKRSFRLVPVFLLLFFYSFYSSGQTQPTKDQPSESKQKGEEEPDKPKMCIKKFKSLTDTYYGVPNIYSIVLTGEAGEPDKRKVTTTSVGPTGGKYEFLLTDKFGIGVDANYSYASASWKEPKTDATGKSVVYSYKLISTAFRSMASLNFHYATKKRVDWYSSFKAGYFNRTFTTQSDDPKYRDPFNRNLWSYWHVALRFETGVRIFLAPFLALNFSAGIGGGPFISSGVSSKF